MTGKLEIIKGIRVHTFEDTREAYDASQCGYLVYKSDSDVVGEEVTVEDGDVLHVPSEGVVGFLLGAWPVAATQIIGEFHAMESRQLIREVNSDPTRYEVIRELIAEHPN